MTKRRRIDRELVARRLVPDRATAAELITDYRVLVNGAIAENPQRLVAGSDQLHVSDPPSKYVGRGAYKLEHGLDTFGVDPADRVVLDAGAATGGFTDVVLQRGARLVYAVDVGRGLLHERLCGDPRVVNYERTNVRHLDPAAFAEAPTLVVGDLSFISLRHVVQPLLAVAAPEADLVMLVKPQFEAQRAEAARSGGVISDEQIRHRIRDEIDDATAAAGCSVLAWTESPIAGASGNREWLMHARAPRCVQ